MNNQRQFSQFISYPTQINRGVGRGALNFEEFAARGNHFINLVADELSCPRNTAARLTRAVIHAVRDRLPAEDAIQFAQGFPMALKAVFIDQYDISRVPVVIRNADDFLDFIYEKDGLAAAADLPTPIAAEEALQGVFRVLENTIDVGQIEQVKALLGRAICDLIEGSQSLQDGGGGATSALYH